MTGLHSGTAVLHSAVLRHVDVCAPNSAKPLSHAYVAERPTVAVGPLIVTEPCSSVSGAHGTHFWT